MVPVWWLLATPTRVIQLCNCVGGKIQYKLSTAEVGIMDSHFGDQFGGASSIYIFVGTFPNIDVVNISGRIAVRFGALSNVNSSVNGLKISSVAEMGSKLV